MALPNPPDPNYFTETQWATYWALTEAVVPVIKPASSLSQQESQLRIPDDEYEAVFKQIQEQLAIPISRDKFDQYLGERITDNPDFLRISHQLIGNLPPAARARLGGALNLLE